jgi:monovalent cation:proton antiporter-2 (CPA2) family protein
MATGFFEQALVYLAAAILLVPIAKKIGLGSVLGYLLAGIVIGPFVLGFVGSEGQDIMHAAEFGVVMMLFLVGLELEPTLLWRLRNSIAGLGGLQVLLTALAVAAIAIATGMVFGEAVTLGLILAMSSTAIVLQTMKEKGLMRSSAGQNAFAVLLFQDIAVIPILALLPLMATSGAAAAASGHEGWLASLPGWAQTLAVLAAVGTVVLAGRTVARPLFMMIAGTRLRELFAATGLLLVVGITVLMTKVGLSPALGTFVGGVVLANSEYRHELESDIEPFKGLLLGLFFVSVGASIDFALFWDSPGTILGLVLLVMILKSALLFLLGRLFGMGTDQGLIFAVSLSQVGEFAFVLTSFAERLGVLHTETASVTMTVVAVSMALTPLAVLVNERLLLPRVGTTEKGAPHTPDLVEEQNAVIIAGFGRYGNIVGRFLKANGVGTTVLDIDSDRVEILRKLNLKVYYGDASRYDLLASAGAAEAKAIIIALDTPEKCLELVKTVRKHFPHLEIFVRAYDRADTYELLELGVKHVYRETLDSSLRMGIDALCAMGHRRYRSTRAARTFHKHDEQALADLAGARKDRSRYLTVARQKIAELERLLQSDINDKALDRDAGWDVESLREEVRSFSLGTGPGEETNGGPLPGSELRRE